MHIVLTDFKLYIYIGPLTTDTPPPPPPPPEHVSVAGLITFCKEPSPLPRKKKKKKLPRFNLAFTTDWSQIVMGLQCRHQPLDHLEEERLAFLLSWNGEDVGL